MIKWNTQYDYTDREPVASCSGDRFHKVYSPEIDKNGHFELVETGTVDVVKEIQSHAESVDLNIILSRYANGEQEVLNRKIPSYGDYSQFPKTYAEMLNIVTRAQRDFDALPLEVRERFGFNYAEYLASAGSAEWCEKLGIDLSSSGQASVGKDVVEKGSEVE